MLEPDTMPPGASTPTTPHQTHWLRLTATYSIVHGLAEFLTGLTLFAMLGTWSGTWQFPVYSLVAFGTPIFIAAALLSGRRSHWPEGVVGLLGALVACAGMVVCHVDWAAVALLGIGSAVLHIAAGTATLKAPRPGTAVGVFESTGAVGLALGSIAGINTGAAVIPWVSAVVMALSGIAVFTWGTDRASAGIGSQITSDWPVTKPRRFSWIKPLRHKLSGDRFVLVALVALMAVSVIRMVVVQATPKPWEQGSLVVAAACCVALGRALGGILADRFGFSATAAAGFVAAAGLLAIWPNAAGTSLAGCFLLGLPMAPVILALTKLTRRTSVAFGLAQVCQVPSALVVGLVLGPWAVLAALLACAAVVVGLARLDQTDAVRPTGHHSSMSWAQ